MCPDPNFGNRCPGVQSGYRVEFNILDYILVTNLNIMLFSFYSLVLSSPSPSLPSVPVRASQLGGNMIVVLGISLCLAVIMATVILTVWRKLCQTPQCSSVHRGSIHSPGGRKLSDEASICGHSLQRPSLSDGHCPSGAVVPQKERPSLGVQPLSPQALKSLSQDPERLSPTGQKVLPPIFGYVYIFFLSIFFYQCLIMFVPSSFSKQDTIFFVAIVWLSSS